MAEMTVASTTDTQKDIDQAAGVVSKLETEETSRATTDEQLEAGADTEHAEEEGGKAGKSGFQKRIDKLTRQRYEDREKIEALTKKLDSLSKPGAGKEGTEEEAEAGKSTEPALRAKPATTDKNADGTPKYKTYEDFTEDLADWKVEEKLSKRAADEQKAAGEKAQRDADQAVFDAYNDQVNEARKVYDDFDEVVGRPGLQIPQAVQLAVVNMDNGAEVAYYLGSHPEVCKKLLTLNDLKAVMEVTRIAAALEPAEAGADEKGEEEVPEKKTAPVVSRRPASAAPAPIRPVGGSATRSSVPLEELPYQEYKKIRNQQIKNRYR